MFDSDENVSRTVLVLRSQAVMVLTAMQLVFFVDGFQKRSLLTSVVSAYVVVFLICLSVRYYQQVEAAYKAHDERSPESRFRHGIAVAIPLGIAVILYSVFLSPSRYGSYLVPFGVCVAALPILFLLQRRTRRS